MFHLQLKEKIESMKSLPLSSAQQGWASQMLETEIPHRKDEEWKYADLSFLKSDDLKFHNGVDAHQVEYNSATKILTVKICSDHPNSQIQVKSLCPGVEFFSRAEFKNYKNIERLQKTTNNQWSYKNFFANTAYSLASHNLLMVLNQEFSPEVKIEIIFDVQKVKVNTVACPSFLCHLQSGVQAKIVETYILPEQSLLVSGVDYFLAAQAQLETLKVEEVSAKARSIHTAKYSLAKDAQLKVVTLTQDSFWSRHNCFIELTESGAHADLRGAYMTTGSNFVDHHTWIDHQVAHTTSSQEYHGVIAGSSRAVFNGKIKIHHDAQKSYTSQINKNLLLSSTAEVDAKPELMIYADDVKASHGATIGQIQKDELFYLLSRGLNEAQAKELLCAGFLRSVGEILSSSLLGQFESHLQQSIPKLVEA